MLPDAKGFTSLIRHLTGLDDALRQRIREEILSTTAADFRAFADVLAQVNEQGHVVTLGSAEAIAAANAQRTDKLTMSKVM
jgi:Zn-dependent M16 (insulinase) family peptidase